MLKPFALFHWLLAFIAALFVLVTDIWVVIKPQ
jgi:hypothetical protein